VFAALVGAATRCEGARRARARTVLVVLLLFGGMLFPVLGFLNVFPFLYSYVADHFQYLASLPIFALAAAALFAARSRVARIAIGTVIAVILGALSFSQAQIYRDSIVLYQATLARNPACWMAHNNLAIDLAARGHIADAIPHLESAIKLAPNFAPAENNLGDDLVRLGRTAEALPHFERAIRLQPNYAAAHRNLGMALAMSNRTSEAIGHFARAVEIEPSNGEAELDWAVALAQTDQFATAVPHFTHAIALMPGSSDAHAAYADALAAHHDFSAAIVEYRAALAVDPDSADVRRGLAAALRQLGRVDEANDQDRAAGASSSGARPGM
jgi:tetratricopeptide (TPR) repeat protein